MNLFQLLYKSTLLKSHCNYFLKDGNNYFFEFTFVYFHCSAVGWNYQVEMESSFYTTVGGNVLTRLFFIENLDFWKTKPIKNIFQTPENSSVKKSLC